MWYLRRHRQPHILLASPTSALLDLTPSGSLYCHSSVLVVLSARLDYANSILYGVTQKNLERLRRVQSSLACVVVGPKVSMLYDSDTLLRNLHWLPVKWRIDFKLAMNGNF